MSDFQTSVRKALEEIDPRYENYDALVVCGTHTPRTEEVEHILDAIRIARETQTPFLGICFGHQLAAIEYARNILGIEDATSEEFGKGTFVVKKRTGLKVGMQDGETYWSNYEVSLGKPWVKAKNFITVPFHPEYQSSIDKPHQLLVDFLNICRK